MSSLAPCKAVDFTNVRTYERTTLTLEFAQELIRIAFAKAKELDVRVSATVVDNSGLVTAYARMDGAPLVAEGASRKKALTAVGFGLKTGEQWHNFIKDDPILSAGVQYLDNFTLLGGGSTVAVDGQVVGAIGVAGGHYKQDEACVEEALRKTNPAQS